MKLSRDWRIYAGGGALAALLLWLNLRKISSSAPAEDVKPGAVPDRWVELEGPMVFLFTGDRYRGCVDVPGLVPNSFVANAIPSKAAELGFRDIVVREGPPRGWPKTKEDCDLFVEATWAGADGVKMARPDRLSGAWRLARA